MPLESFLITQGVLTFGDSFYSLWGSLECVSCEQNPVLKDVFVAFQVIPRLKEGNNYEVVDKAIEVVKAANVPYQVSAIETTMKG
ncbi:MAG: hypothetical protein CENE_00988 [Candidatus Celerinatantimonas neptuna]|nr:MAG: hypothetical protein CENE_00988 [Candidatus Celerinatantimonas neptuna]